MENHFKYQILAITNIDDSIHLLILTQVSIRIYMTEVLKIDPEGEKQLSIAAFGSARGSSKLCPIVSVGLILKGNPSMTMSLFIVPMICEPLIGRREMKAVDL